MPWLQKPSPMTPKRFDDYAAMPIYANPWHYARLRAVTSVTSVTSVWSNPRRQIKSCQHGVMLSTVVH